MHKQRNKETKTDTIEHLKQQLTKFQRINNELQTKLDEEMSKNENLKQTVEQNKILIEELTEANEMPENLGKSKSNENENNNAITIDENDDELMTKTSISKFIKNEMKIIANMMTNEMNKSLGKKCTEMKETIMKEMNENDRAQTNKKNVTINTPKTHKSTKNDNERAQTKIDTYLKPPPPPPTPQQQQQNVGIQESTNIHEIYVAKFKLGTTTEAIKQHIMDKTTIIHPECFKVTELQSKKENRDYVAFKISTLQIELYNEIMGIWAPDFTARKYETAKIVHTDINRNGLQRYRGKPYEQNSYATQNAISNNRRFDNRFVDTTETPRINRYGRDARGHIQQRDRRNYDWKDEKIKQFKDEIERLKASQNKITPIPYQFVTYNPFQQPQQQQQMIYQQPHPMIYQNGATQQPFLGQHSQHQQVHTKPQMNNA